MDFLRLGTRHVLPFKTILDRLTPMPDFIASAGAYALLRCTAARSSIANAVSSNAT